MKQSPELQPRRSIEQRLHVSLRRLHDETGTATYASLSCPANFRAPTLPVFMLIAEGDGAVTSLRISRDLNRDVESYRIHIREHRLDGLQKCSDWIDEEHVNSFINKLLMLADHGDLGPSSWMHLGQNMLANPLDSLCRREREPLSLMSMLTAS